MKLIVIYLTLLVTTVVYASTLSKREESCWTQNEEYKECNGGNMHFVIDIEKEDSIRKGLNKYCSKKCKEFYKDFKTALSSCDLTDDQIKELEERKIEQEFLCTKDESDDYCPYVKNSMEDVAVNYNPLFILKETCKSKKCKEAIINTSYDEAKSYLKSTLPDKKINDKKMTYLEYLNSDECLKLQDEKKSKCWEKNSKYRECNYSDIDDIKNENIDERKKFMDNYCSKTCKDFYENYNTTLSDCEFSVSEIKTIEENKIAHDFYCTKDGGDNYCPIVRKVIDLTSVKYNNEFILKETCKSKLCTEAIVNSNAEDAKDFREEDIKIENVEKTYLDYLKSDECVKQNDAKTIARISSSLLLTLSLLLVFLI